MTREDLVSSLGTIARSGGVNARVVDPSVLTPVSFLKGRPRFKQLKHVILKKRIGSKYVVFNLTRVTRGVEDRSLRSGTAKFMEMLSSQSEGENLIGKFGVGGGLVVQAS